MRWFGRELRENGLGKGSRGHLWLAPVFFLLVLTAGLVSAPAPRAILPDARALRGSQPYATLLCAFADQDDSQRDAWPVSYYDRLMTAGDESVDAYWRRVSYGAIDLAGSKAFGWFPMPKPAQAYQRHETPAPDLDALARDCTGAAGAAGNRAPDFSQYVGLNLVFSQCLDRPRGGAMDLRLDGRKRSYRLTWLCPGYASSHQIFAHEIGHSFGLTHSEGDQGSEYGNHWDLMSNVGYCAATTELGAQAQQPIAYAKDLLGWIDPADKYTARRSEVATIQLDELDRGLRAPGGFLLAVLPLPAGRFYTVEARGRTGYDLALPSAGVLIHEIDPKRENRARLVKGETAIGPGAVLSASGGWPVGSAFVDRQNNVAMSVDQQVDGGFVVTLYTGSLPWPLPYAKAARGDAVRLQWQPSSKARRYEVQIARASPVVAGDEWGATFVSDRPSLDAPLAPGHYRWQVRRLPDGPWAPPQLILVGHEPSWHGVEQIAQLNGRLRVPPVVSAQANGSVEVAWAYDDRQSTVSVTRAALQGNAWAVEDFIKLPSAARKDLALSFTPSGDLKVTRPAVVAKSTLGASTPAVALDAGGRAHTIWAGTGRGKRGIFSAIIEAHTPSAGPVAAATPAAQPVPVDRDGSNVPKYSPALALDGEGNARAVWVDTRDGHSAVYGAEQLPGGTWGPSRRLSNPDQAVFGRPSVAVNSQGDSYVVWQGSLGCQGAVPAVQVSFAERPAGRLWQAPVTLFVAAGGAQLVDPIVSANDAGDVFVAWGELRSGTYRLYAAYRGALTVWESPRLLAEGRTYGMSLALSLAVSPTGDAYLAWAEQRYDGGSVRLATAR